MLRIGKKDKITCFGQLGELVEPSLDPEQNLLKMTRLKISKDGDVIFVTGRWQHSMSLNNPPARNGCSKHVKAVGLQVFPMHNPIVAR
jgi:hypothetical protein